MGYETRLYVGKSTSLTHDVYKRSDKPEIDGEDVYYPYEKDNEGNLITTGKKSTWFEVMAMIDLCKTGHGSEISKIDFKNTDESHYWYFYSGNKEIIDDNYGDKSKPIPISVVLEALKKDYQESEYRRFKWAIALLESMAEDKEELSVLFYGH